MHSVHLTTDQFKTLLKLVYLGEWVVNAHKVERDEEFDELTKHLFSLTKDFNIPDISLEEDPQYPCADYENGEVRDYIDEYNELTFWDELTQRLTDKLFTERYTPEQRQSMDRSTRSQTLCRLEEEVNTFLKTTGINQIVIN